MTRPRGTDPVGFGIVGAGTMGAFHARALAEHPDVRLVAIANRGGDPARELAERMGADCYLDWESLVADDRVDAVVVATPDAAHTDIAVGAARAGKAVLIEKPLATSTADARAVVDAVRTNGVVASVLFNHRWVPAYAHAYELARDGQLGAPVLGYARKNDRIHVPTRMLSWASDTTPAWFLSSHDIDLVNWMFGDRPVTAYASAVNGRLRELGVDAPDAIQAQVRYAGGGVATFEACWIYPDSFPTMTDSFVEVVYADGVLHLDRKADQLELATSQAYEYPRHTLMRTMHGVPAGAVRDCLWHFVDCVRTGREPLVTVEAAATTTAVLEAIHRSIASGRPEQVESIESRSASEVDA